jgi:hypothetical protein
MTLHYILFMYKKTLRGEQLGPTELGVQKGVACHTHSRSHIARELVNAQFILLIDTTLDANTVVTPSQ